MLTLNTLCHSNKPTCILLPSTKVLQSYMLVAQNDNALIKY